MWLLDLWKLDTRIGLELDPAPAPTKFEKLELADDEIGHETGSSGRFKARASNNPLLDFRFGASNGFSSGEEVIELIFSLTFLITAFPLCYCEC